MLFGAADLCDEHVDLVQVAEPGFHDFGFRETFMGPIATLVAPGDYPLVAAVLEETGRSRVLVVDGQGAVDCALPGDRPAFYEHNWSGLIINGCVRDSGELDSIDIGIKALGAFPRRGDASSDGKRDTPVTFAGVTFRPGNWIYADRDGLLVSEQKLV